MDRWPYGKVSVTITLVTVAAQLLQASLHLIKSNTYSANSWWLWSLHVEEMQNIYSAVSIFFIYHLPDVAACAEPERCAYCTCSTFP